MYARMSRYFELPSLSLQSPHWTTWAEIFPVKESFEHFKLFGCKEIWTFYFLFLSYFFAKVVKDYGSGAHNRLNISFWSQRQSGHVKRIHTNALHESEAFFFKIIMSRKWFRADITRSHASKPLKWLNNPNYLNLSLLNGQSSIETILNNKHVNQCARVSAKKEIGLLTNIIRSTAVFITVNRSLENIQDKQCKHLAW